MQIPTLKTERDKNFPVLLDSLDIPPNEICLRIPNICSLSSFGTWMNQACLVTLIPWLRQDQNVRANIWSFHQTFPMFSNLINGVAIDCRGTDCEYRLILLPSAAIDRCELRIPQEWVDIPEWIGDYYLAVAVDPDENCLTLWGYTTHQKIKTLSAYDECDRSYVIDGDRLIQDLSVLSVFLRSGILETTRYPIKKLPFG